MGKRIISQARGKGGPRYRAPSFNYAGKIGYPKGNEVTYSIVDIIHSPGHNAPLLRLKSNIGEEFLNVAPEGVRVGQTIYVGENGDSISGNILALKNIPEGTPVFNIERKPGDGGKFVRSSGNSARIINQTEEGVVVQLPSKKKKLFHPMCRATIGIVAGGGRTDKPMLKAGVSYYKHKAKNKLYPKVSGASMNAVDHPFGNSRSSRKSKARPISKNAPRGRKVGLVGAKRTGRK